MSSKVLPTSVASGNAAPQNSSFNIAVPGRYRLSAAEVWAFCGCFLLAAQAYTLYGFFTHPITSATPSGPFNAAAYWGARSNEVLGVVVAIIMLTVVIRQCRAAGRLTFDAKFCIAGFLTYWCDPANQFFVPDYFNSSYYINVHDWTGYMPFIVNPDAGTTTENPVFYWPLYTFGFLLYAMFLNWIMRKVARWFPEIGMVYMWFVAFFVGAAIEIATEVYWLKIGLEAYPGAPEFLAIPVGSMKLPFIEYFSAGILFGCFACVRYYVNKNGERITERGLERYSSKASLAISTIAMTAILNTLVLSVLIFGNAVASLYSTAWPSIPQQLIEGVCDQGSAPYVTRYGPCPGSPGFRVPLKGDLKGSNPHGWN